MSTKPHIHVIILAAGCGKRMPKKRFKQFFLLEKKPIVMHTILKLFKIIPKANFNIVLPENKINYWKSLCKKYNFLVPHTIFKGGETRFFSVKNTISSLCFKQNDLVFIHDSVRPFFSKQLIKRLINSAQKKGHSVPVIEIKDSLRRKNKNIDNTISVDRSNFLLTQTPQVFRAEIIKKAYSRKSNQIKKTDDVSLIEEFIFPINLIYGEELNFKITNQKDWELAQIIAPNFL